MRLLNVKTGSLEEYYSADIPQYVILSHTWGDDEVSFSDMNRPVRRTKFTREESFSSSHHPSVQAKAGYAKIRYTCEQAVHNRYDYAWIDTCCIDKRSSSELSEAINSMFHWYQAASICYAYLEDVPENDPLAFSSSRWWTRGWTLQELLAPRRIVFFGKDWARIGTKARLVDQISAASGVEQETLLNPGLLNSISIARRMSWASKRATTRVEDMAYCLLGIFGVNMPLLYGEGNKAFIRLQEEILKQSDDQSIFAWTMSPEDLRASSSDPNPPSFAAIGILASSPKYFASASKITPVQSKRLTTPYTMTNRGLQIKLPLFPINNDELPEAGSQRFIGVLDCQAEDDFSNCLGVCLVRMYASQVLWRLEGLGSGMQQITPVQAARAEIQKVYIHKDMSKEQNFLDRSGVTCRVISPTLPNHGFEVIGVLRPNTGRKHHWNAHTQVLRMEVPEEVDDLQYISFVFYNAVVKVGFAIRMNLRDDEETPFVRITCLKGELPESASLQGWVLRQTDHDPNVSKTLLDHLTYTYEHGDSYLTYRFSAKVAKRDIFVQKLFFLEVACSAVQTAELDGWSSIVELPASPQDRPTLPDNPLLGEAEAMLFDSPFDSRFERSDRPEIPRIPQISESPINEPPIAKATTKKLGWISTLSYLFVG